MDSTTNDNDHVAVKGFPTIVFFPAGSKVSPSPPPRSPLSGHLDLGLGESILMSPQQDKPVTYEGPRTVEGFVSFLNQHAT